MDTFWRDLAEKITHIWREEKKLPYRERRYAYDSISAMYTADKQFSGFIYSNAWGTENIEDQYRYFFGPFLSVGEVLSQVWDRLTYDEQTVVMAEILGSKHVDK